MPGTLQQSQAPRFDLSSQVLQIPQPSSTLVDSFLQLAKKFSDPVAANVAEAQLRDQLQQRQQGRKRKRSQGDQVSERDQRLGIKKLHVDGFGVEQVWQQDKRIQRAVIDQIRRDLSLPDSISEDVESEINTEVSDEQGQNLDQDGESTEESLGEEGVDWEYEGDEYPQTGQDTAQDPAGFDGDAESAADQSGLDNDLLVSDSFEESPTELVKDKHGLNDGFFSIDEFNRQSEFLEGQDAKGDPNDGAASDEEDIDWTTDPLEPGANIGFGGQGNGKAGRKGKTGQEDGGEAGSDDQELDDDNNDDDEKGPTFDDADLSAPWGESEEDDIDLEEEEADYVGAGNDFSNTNDILYKDFFAPPARERNIKSTKSSRPKKPVPNTGRAADQPSANAEPMGRNRLAREDDQDDSEHEMQRAMSSVHRDLFEDSGDDEDEDKLTSDEEDVSSGTKASRPGDAKMTREHRQDLSTHERRELELREQIREIEVENVAPKPFTLAGETVAPARSENALLEEDLDFERAGKPVPVITQEVNESIEDLIKRRIVARNFDNLIRRAPEIVDPSAGQKAKVFDEISDTKPKRGLADEYADDYLRQNDPNYVDPRSEAVKREHAAIESQWRQVSSALDALSNWHYKPRPPEPNIEVRTDAPVVRMEEARPAGAEGMSDDINALAPQEVYRAGDKAEKLQGVSTTKGGTVVAKEEESRGSRLRRRRRDKERRRKAEANKALANGSHASTADSKGSRMKGSRAEKNKVVGHLKRGGVKIIGKKGQLEDMEGNQMRPEGKTKKASSYLL